MFIFKVTSFGYRRFKLFTHREFIFICIEHDIDFLALVGDGESLCGFSRESAFRGDSSNSNLAGLGHLDTVGRISSSFAIADLIGKSGTLSSASDRHSAEEVNIAAIRRKRRRLRSNKEFDGEGGSFLIVNLTFRINRSNCHFSLFSRSILIRATDNGFRLSRNLQFSCIFRRESNLLVFIDSDNPLDSSRLRSNIARHLDTGSSLLYVEMLSAEICRDIITCKTGIACVIG